MVGSPNWNTELGQQVTWMANNQQQTAVLTLNPPDLGPMRIVINLSDSQQQLGASFMAAQPETRAAIEAAMPRLREMLDSAGIQLGQTNVSSGGPQSNDWTGGNRDTSNKTGQSAFFGADNEAGGLEAVIQPPASLQRTGAGLIDTHA